MLPSYISCAIFLRQAAMISLPVWADFVESTMTTDMNHEVRNALLRLSLASLYRLMHTMEIRAAIAGFLDTRRSLRAIALSAL